jgi:hypothetical protein
LIEGGNPNEIKCLKNLGELRHKKPKDANAEAISFIDKVGLQTLKAVKDGLVTNSDVKC